MNEYLTALTNWLRPYEAEYTVNRDATERFNHIVASGFTPRRVQDDQSILFTAVHAVFQNSDEFKEILRNVDQRQHEYATHVLHALVDEVDPGDANEASQEVDTLDALIGSFTGEDFASYISKIKTSMQRLSALLDPQNTRTIAKQVLRAMREWCRDNPTDSRSRPWDLFASTTVLTCPALQLTVEHIASEGKRYERSEVLPLFKKKAVPAASTSKRAPGMAFVGANTDATRPHCLNCGRYNHEVKDCVYLDNAEERYCRHCKTRTHWTHKCRYVVAADRESEKRKDCASITKTTAGPAGVGRPRSAANDRDRDQDRRWGQGGRSVSGTGADSYTDGVCGP
jgi:hypothetical protein